MTAVTGGHDVYQSMLGSKWNDLLQDQEANQWDTLLGDTGGSNQLQQHVPLEYGVQPGKAVPHLGMDAPAGGVPLHLQDPGMRNQYHEHHYAAEPYIGRVSQHERVINEYDEPAKLISQKEVEHEAVRKPQITIEKHYEVPHVVVKERVETVPKIVQVERIIEQPKVEFIEHVKDVPVRQIREIIREVPIDVVEDRILHVPKIIHQERIIEKPKIEYVEKIEYVDTIEYREVPFDTYVEVPEIEYVYKEVDVPVPQPVFQEVPEYHYKEVPQVQVQQVHRIEQVDVPIMNQMVNVCMPLNVAQQIFPGQQYQPAPNDAVPARAAVMPMQQPMEPMPQQQRPSNTSSYHANE